MRNTQSLLMVLAILVSSPSAIAQGQSKSGSQSQRIPIDTQWTIDAAGPIQRNAITSVLLLNCTKTNMKGTGFVLNEGHVITAAHVVAGCQASEVTGTTPLSGSVSFSRIAREENVDLAALVPTETLQSGLQLGSDAEVPLGKSVTTWGFPLIYNGPAPLLSVGYISGYYGAEIEGHIFKHIVINAALNPGNSGGPVFLSGDDKVVGVVIWKEIAFSDQVKEAIKGFHNPGIRTGGTFSERQPDGTYKPLSDQEVIARVLEEFYKKTQVGIGEAVSVSELRKFLNEHKKELSPHN